MVDKPLPCTNFCQLLGDLRWRVSIYINQFVGIGCIGDNVSKRIYSTAKTLSGRNTNCHGRCDRIHRSAPLAKQNDILTNMPSARTGISHRGTVLKSSLSKARKIGASRANDYPISSSERTDPTFQVMLNPDLTPSNIEYVLISRIRK